jgi:hydrogenase/urease accessory protein HupE
MAAWPAPACAHSPVPGFEGFYTGLFHPFSTPSQALLILGIGLLAGGFDVARARWYLGAFLAATLFGLFMGGMFPGSGAADVDAILFAAAFAACAWSALGPGKLAPIAIALVAIGGVLIGILSVPDPGPTRDRIITMTGSVLGANAGFLYVLGFVLFVRDRFMWEWVKIAFRVVAAWLGAISLVMLALGFAARGGGLGS